MILHKDWHKTNTTILGLRSISSVQLLVSDSLRPHEPQHARPPCPSPTPRVHPNPCPLCQWCHPTISSSVVPLSCPQSFPASGSFQIVFLNKLIQGKHILFPALHYRQRLFQSEWIIPKYENLKSKSPRKERKAMPKNIHTTAQLH